MTDREVDLLPAMPALAALFAKALLPRVDGGPARVPTATAVVVGIRPDPQRLADYDRVCGFTLRNHVPSTWLHVLTFPLHVHLLGGPDSTIRLAGAVHASNRMQLHRPVAGTEVLDAAVRIENLRPHRRGAQLDVISELRVGEELVWDGVSTYLAPEAKVTASPPDPYRRRLVRIESQSEPPIRIVCVDLLVTFWTMIRRVSPSGATPPP